MLFRGTIVLHVFNPLPPPPLFFLPPHSEWHTGGEVVADAGGYRAATHP